MFRAKKEDNIFFENCRGELLRLVLTIEIIQKKHEATKIVQLRRRW